MGKCYDGAVIVRVKMKEGQIRQILMYNEVESEEPTEFGVVWERFVIPETEACDIDRTGDESDGKTERDELDGNGSHWTIEARKERVVVLGEDKSKTSSTTASPCMHEFETFFGEKRQG
jgi:hypothetical protein